MMVVDEEELQNRYNSLKEGYDVTEHNIFHYKDYVQQCTGNPLSPEELICQRNSLFDEMSRLWRQLPHEEKEGLDKWL